MGVCGHIYHLSSVLHSGNLFQVLSYLDLKKMFICLRALDDFFLTTPSILLGTHIPKLEVSFPSLEVFK